MSEKPSRQLERPVLKPTFERALISPRFSYPPSGLFYGPLGPKQKECRDVVAAKVKKGEYATETVPCFCGGAQFKVLAQVDRFGLQVQTVLCRHCGLLSTNPRMNQSAYASFYEKEYRALYLDIADPQERYQECLRQSKVVYDFVASHLSLPTAAKERGESQNNPVVFEIGSNMGATLSVFQSHGFEAAGTDYGVRNIELGKTMNGIENLYVGGIERLEEDGRKADLFLLQHVLEHFLDPETMVKRIRNLLKPEGHIFIEVPGLYGWITTYCKSDLLEYLQNAHTYHFSLATLDYVMESCGFEKVAGDEYIRSIYRVSENFRPKDDVPSQEPARIETYLRSLEKNITPRLIVKKAAAVSGLLRLKRWLTPHARTSPYDC